MITAEQARKMSEEGEAKEYERYRHQIYAAIERAALAGRDYAIIDSREDVAMVRTTALIKELEDRGFRVSHEIGCSYKISWGPV